MLCEELFVRRVMNFVLIEVNVGYTRLKWTIISYLITLIFSAKLNENLLSTENKYPSWQKLMSPLCVHFMYLRKAHM
jgi:hypothetical protein